MDPDILTTGDRRVRTNSKCNKFRHFFTSSCTSSNAGSDREICSFTSSQAAASAGPTSAALAAAAPETGSAGSLLRDRDIGEVPIGVLAQGFIVDSMPVEVEDYYGADDVALLIEMLRDPDFQDNHRTIATLIGLISDGDDEHVGALAEYAEQPGSDVSAASMAIGYIASRAGSELALELLLTKLPASGRAGKAAALGLIVSGDSRAAAALEAKASRETQNREKLLEAVAENREIAKLGLRRYYRQAEVRREEADPDPEPLPGGVAWQEFE